MINLLPPQHKQDIRAARANSLLIRYNFLLLGALAFLMLAIGIVYVYLTSAKASDEKTIKDNQSNVAGFASVEEQAQIFRNNLSVAKLILDKEVNYTKVILSIAKVLPAGTIL